MHFRVPKAAGVNYRYVEVVRKHHLRRQMDAFACLQCRQVLSCVCVFCRASDKPCFFDVYDIVVAVLLPASSAFRWI